MIEVEKNLPSQIYRFIREQFYLDSLNPEVPTFIADELIKALKNSAPDSEFNGVQTKIMFSELANSSLIPSVQMFGGERQYQKKEVKGGEIIDEQQVIPGGFIAIRVVDFETGDMQVVNFSGFESYPCRHIFVHTNFSFTDDVYDTGSTDKMISDMGAFIIETMEKQQAWIIFKLVNRRHIVTHKRKFLRFFSREVYSKKKEDISYVHCIYHIPDWLQEKIYKENNPPQAQVVNTPNGPMLVSDVPPAELPDEVLDKLQVPDYVRAAIKESRPTTTGNKSGIISRNAKIIPFPSTVRNDDRPVLKFHNEEQKKIYDLLMETTRYASQKNIDVEDYKDSIMNIHQLTNRYDIISHLDSFRVKFGDDKDVWIKAISDSYNISGHPYSKYNRYVTQYHITKNDGDTVELKLPNQKVNAYIDEVVDFMHTEKNPFISAIVLESEYDDSDIHYHLNWFMFNYKLDDLDKKLILKNSKGGTPK